MSRIRDDNRINIVGPNVRRIRTAKGWSQQLLSDRLELIPVYICRGSISRIEERVRTVTDFEIAGLAETLGVTIEDLFAEKE